MGGQCEKKLLNFGSPCKMGGGRVMGFAPALIKNN